MLKLDGSDAARRPVRSANVETLPLLGRLHPPPQYNRPITANKITHKSWLATYRLGTPPSCLAYNELTAILVDFPAIMQKFSLIRSHQLFTALVLPVILGCDFRTGRSSSSSGVLRAMPSGRRVQQLVRVGVARAREPSRCQWTERPLLLAASPHLLGSNYPRWPRKTCCCTLSTVRRA